MSTGEMSTGNQRVLTLATPLARAFDEEEAELLDAELGLSTVGDLIRHFPFRYEGGAAVDEGGRAAEPRIGDEVVVLGTITKVTRPVPGRTTKRPLTRMDVATAARTYTVSFFRHMPKVLDTGRKILLVGKLGEFNGMPQLTHPDWILVPGGDLSAADALAQSVAAQEHKGKGKGKGPIGSARLKRVNLELLMRDLVPVYHGTKKLPTWAVMSYVDDALKRLGPVQESLPDLFRAVHGLMDLDQALRGIHRPNHRRDAVSARGRLAHDEAMAIETVLAQRAATNDGEAAPALTPRADVGGAGVSMQTELRQSLPFELTAGQEQVLGEILTDLDRSRPMNRLLQGEVGSGKTLVALLAMLRAVDTDHQAVILAPTEVLATQHYFSISAMLGPLAMAGQLGAADRATTVTLLTGAMTTRARRAALLRIATGEAGIVIGTHALLEDTVDFFRLGLVVVDEQHRFGVEQRDVLRRKGYEGRTPHLLVMTATPIPRTVALTQFGDMATSTLTELPRGRQPIQTSVVPAGKPAWVARVWARCHEEVAAGRQVYVVCPRIGDDPDAPAGTAPADEDYDFEAMTPADSGGAGERDPGGADAAEAPPMTAAVQMFEDLREGPLGAARIALLHGRLPAEEKSKVMADFSAGDIDVLVSTTVIEVGVDVANATTMVIMDAERFGISQLHQLRGRVGRGGLPGLCLLVTSTQSDRTGERLRRVASTTDGFALAQLDLEYRGFGDILGTDQSGLARRLSFLDLARDEAILAVARELAFELVGGDPELEHYPGLRRMNEAVLGADRESFLSKS